MRIEDRFKIFQLYSNSTRINRVDKGRKTDSADKVEISEQARDFQAILNAIKNAPDVRNDKINEIKQRIESGTYSVSAKDIVEKLVKDYRSTKT